MSATASAGERARGALAVPLLVASFTTALVAFGGRSLAAVVIGTALAAAGSALVLSLGPGGRVPRLALAGATALVAISLASLIPLPRGLAAALSPRRVEMADAQAAVAARGQAWLAAGRGQGLSLAQALDESASQAGSRGTGPGPEPSPAVEAGSTPLSFDPPATRIAAGVLACWVALALALSRHRRPGLAVLMACSVATALMGAYAIAWAHVGNGKVYGIFEAPPNVGQQPFGPFWNPNHFAALLAAFGVLSIAVVLHRESGPWLRGLALLGALIFWSGVGDAGSRGGVLGATAGLVCLGFLLLLGPRSRRVVGVAILGLAVLGVVVATLVAPRLILEQDLDEATRMAGSNFERARIYRAELGMVASAPLAGVGLGSFRTAYPAFQAEPDPLVPLHGESDWLESLSEGGAPLALAWIALIGGLLWPALRALRGEQAPALLAGLVAAAAALLAHAAVDFHLREPSVALVAIVLAATASAWGSSLREAAPAPTSDGAGRAATVTLALVGAACLGLVAARHVRWDAGLREGEIRYVKGDVAGALESATRATLAWPKRAQGWALRAACEEALAREAKPGQRAARREQALSAAVEALRRNVLALGAARVAGQMLVAAGADREALEAAQLAARAAPGHAASRRLLGQALLRAGRGEEALPHLAFAFTALPFEQSSQQAKALTRMLRDAGGADSARVFAALRDRDARVRYMHRLLADGHEDEIAACLAVVSREGVSGEDADAWAYALIGGSQEAADLGRRLLPMVTQPISRVRIARALLAQPGTEAAGLALLREVVEAPEAPGEAFWTLALEQRARGQAEEAAATIRAGLAAHPDDATLQSLRR